MFTSHSPSSRVTPGRVARKAKDAAYMLTYDIRHQNYLGLFARFKRDREREFPGAPDMGSLKKFAESVGIPPAYASHLKRGYKRVGEHTARGLETALKLPVGWFDHEHPEMVELAKEIDPRAGERLRQPAAVIEAPVSQPAPEHTAPVFMEHHGGEEMLHELHRMMDELWTWGSDRVAASMFELWLKREMERRERKH